MSINEKVKFLLVFSMLYLAFLLFSHVDLNAATVYNAYVQPDGSYIELDSVTIFENKHGKIAVTLENAEGTRYYEAQIIAGTDIVKGTEIKTFIELPDGTLKEEE